jgi:lipid-A-disaccharide synthase-like uncharacterized protein
MAMRQVLLTYAHLQFPESFWLILGFTAQLLFSARFLVQWIASERARRSVVPISFWFLSILGGILLLSYAIRRRDPVFIAGQAMGVCVYARNLVLIWRSKTSQYTYRKSSRAVSRIGMSPVSRPSCPGRRL